LYFFSILGKKNQRGDEKKIQIIIQNDNYWRNCIFILFLKPRKMGMVLPFFHRSSSMVSSKEIISSSSSSSPSSVVHPLSSILPRSKQREHQAGDENERGSCLTQRTKRRHDINLLISISFLEELEFILLRIKWGYATGRMKWRFLHAQEFSWQQGMVSKSITSGLPMPFLGVCLWAFLSNSWSVL